MPAIPSTYPEAGGGTGTELTVDPSQYPNVFLDDLLNGLDLSAVVARGCAIQDSWWSCRRGEDEQRQCGRWRCRRPCLGRPGLDGVAVRSELASLVLAPGQCCNQPGNNLGLCIENNAGLEVNLEGCHNDPDYGRQIWKFGY